MTNQLPTIPENIYSEVIGTSVLLFWDSATDPETLPENLTYNVKLGTTSGSSNILSSMSNPAGFRFINQFGNAGYNTSLEIANLSPGQYYCSVQAIDNNFAGSGFSDELSFTVTPLNVDDIATLNNQSLKVFPNPFHNNVLIEFITAEVKLTEARILNSYGKTVIDLKSDNTAGQIYWNGRDNNGLEIYPGIYFLSIKIEGNTILHKMLKY